MRVDPYQYKKYVLMDKGKRVLYVRLNKALCGTLKEALLFWENLSSNIMNKWGLKMNLYDICVAKNTIERRQCKILWHVDDLKISHVDSNVVDDIIEILDNEYDKDPETLLMVHCGKTYDYLGMTINYNT